MSEFPATLRRRRRQTLLLIGSTYKTYTYYRLQTAPGNCIHIKSSCLKSNQTTTDLWRAGYTPAVQQCEKPAVITCLPPVSFHSLQFLLLLATQWPVRALVKLLRGSRPSNFTPIHSLPGPVGQVFASRLGGQQFVSCECTNSHWNQVSPVSTVSLQYIHRYTYTGKRTTYTAGAVSIATISEKTAGTKIEISPLRYMIETSGFFLCTHICSSNISERKGFKLFNHFVDM